MWTFVKVKSSMIDYGWMLRIDDPMQVLEYHQSVDPSKASRIVDQIRKVKIEKVKHFADELSFVIAKLSEIKGTSVVMTLANFNTLVTAQQMESIRRCGAIYVNRNGGYFPCKGDIEECEVEQSKVLSFPTVRDEDDIRIIKWPQGKHWYAKIGDTDVVVDGEQKWNTKAAAKAAAKKFLMELD